MTHRLIPHYIPTIPFGAEGAYYRLLLLEGTRAELGAVLTELMSLRATIRTARGIDLTKSPSAHTART